MQTTYTFTAVFTPADEGGFTAYVPLLPGCISEGNTLEEAQKNIQEATELYIESLEEDGVPIPGSQKETYQIQFQIQKEDSSREYA